MESDSKCNNEGGVGHEVTKDCPHNLFAIELKKTCRTLRLGLFAFTSRHLGGHVGVDADGWEHGEVEEEVPACEENQGGCEGPVHKQDLDKHSHGKNHSKVFQRTSEAARGLGISRTFTYCACTRSFPGKMG